jgi:hypothetical protein
VHLASAARHNPEIVILGAVQQRMAIIHADTGDAKEESRSVAFEVDHRATRSVCG